MTRITAPFRADHVGSFLRPKFLLDAREQFKQNTITRAQLRAVEDRAIRDVVRFQEDLGRFSPTTTTWSSRTMPASCRPQAMRRTIWASSAQVVVCQMP